MIEARNITKFYRIPHEKTGTLFEQLLGRLKNRIMYEDFYAIKNASFSIQKGEMVGLIGKNGSGKTTLLKILGGIIEPTTGSFLIEGTVAPLLSLSVGFHNELSAKENLYLYGAVLGMSRREIKERLMAIFEFAGLGRFADMKLKHFSSGMTARLAFATMVQTDPDVRLLDEIFAVGDKDFIPHCVSILNSYKHRGKTIIFASHDLTAVAKHCNKTILLDKGELKMFDETKKVLEYYKNL